MVTVCPSQFATRRTLFHVLVGCGLLMLKVSRLKLPVIWLLVSMWLNTLRSEERFSRNAETDLVCRLLLEKKKKQAIRYFAYACHVHRPAQKIRKITRCSTYSLRVLFRYAVMRSEHR